MLTDLSFLLQKHCWGPCQQRSSHGDQIPARWRSAVLSLWRAACCRGQVRWRILKWTHWDQQPHFFSFPLSCLSLRECDGSQCAEKACSMLLSQFVPYQKKGGIVWVCYVTLIKYTWASIFFLNLQNRHKLDMISYGCKMNRRWEYKIFLPPPSYHSLGLTMKFCLCVQDICLRFLPPETSAPQPLTFITSWPFVMYKGNENIY